ncbi:transporter substrate-binding domain-containing protein [Sphaerospermopsis aphanizomenoides BCCUSP55]|uniref:transporter substrate-binding domain-containing protein n=1 Tax=Sphaerospermopsis aphanizomenoides TaxID=459663 RepID=UPI000AB407DA|nr:transporter substrate-binding domain-containing protein [Sphaerospermopsis aphanizomenoides]MBK1990607.1 transporter substrate-binding domain-containing protein [Sphaerospermopsis aphanizomenoides BCCUSP55]
MSRLHLVLSATLILIFCLFSLGTDLVASAATLPEIHKRGYLTVAVKYNLRPLGFRDKNGNLQGLEIDLAQRLASDLLGKPDAVKFRPVANSDRLPAILEHKVDLVIANVTATASRSRIVSFSVPYYYDGAAIVTKNTNINQLKDLDKRKIAVLKNSSNIYYVKYFIPNAELVGVNSYAQAREKIESNAVDAVAADNSVLSGWVQESPQYHLLKSKLSAEPLSVVMPKGLQYDELRRWVNEAIARYTATGWLKERTQYWGLGSSH